MVEWLEQLGYGAESRRKAWVRGSASPCGDWKTLSVNPAVNGYLFRIREGYGSERKGTGSAFHQLCPRYSGTLTPTAPTAIRLWETFTFLNWQPAASKTSIGMWTWERVEVWGHSNVVSVYIATLPYVTLSCPILSCHVRYFYGFP